jgi:hypothetical protein
MKKIKKYIKKLFQAERHKNIKARINEVETDSFLSNGLLFIIAIFYH